MKSKNNFFLCSRQLTVIVVGLDNSGKTSMSRALVGGIFFFISSHLLFYRLFFLISTIFSSQETFTDTVPTIGFSKFVTKQKGITINIYDLGYVC